MAKAASKGKLANKVSSKKNKKSLSVKNQKTLENSDKFKVGSKNDNIPKGKFILIIGKVGCVFLIIIVSIAPEPMIDLREDAPNYTLEYHTIIRTSVP